jgi:hypothetical protein
MTPMLTPTILTRPSFSSATKAEWLAYEAMIAELRRLDNIGAPIYVTFNEYADQRRQNSVGRMHEFKILTRPVRRFYSNRKQMQNHQGLRGTYDVILSFISIKWDGRPGYYKASPLELVWLKDYQGPTVWKWEKPQGPLVIPRDRTGREIVVGDFLTYILYHHDSHGSGIYFGSVTKIDRDGTIWARNVKVNETETTVIKRIKNNSETAVLTTDLLDRIMLLKLSNF